MCCSVCAFFRFEVFTVLFYFYILYFLIFKFLSSFYLLDGAKEMDKILKNVDQELANSGGPYFLGKNN